MSDISGGMYTADSSGVTRLKSSQSTGGNLGAKGPSDEVRGTMGLPGVADKISGGVGKAGNSSPNTPQTQVDPNHIAALQEAAANGDTDAQGLLDVLLGAGAAGGTFLVKALMNKKRPPLAGNSEVPGSLVPTGPTSPKVTQLKDEQVVPRTARAGYLEGPKGPKLQSGGQARTGSTTATAPKGYLTDQPTNPRNLPVSRQGATDAAYATKAAQDAKAAKNFEGANPGRLAKEARMAGYAAAFRRVVK